MTLGMRNKMTDEEKMAKLGLILRRGRIREKVSFKELACLTDITANTIVDFELGKKSMSVLNLKRVKHIADVLGLDFIKMTNGVGISSLIIRNIFGDIYTQRKPLKGYVIARGLDQKQRPLLFVRWNIHEIPQSVKKVRTACFSSTLEPRVFNTEEEARSCVCIPGMQVVKYG